MENYIGIFEQNGKTKAYPVSDSFHPELMDEYALDKISETCGELLTIVSTKDLPFLSLPIKWKNLSTTVIRYQYDENENYAISENKFLFNFYGVGVLGYFCTDDCCVWATDCDLNEIPVVTKGNWFYECRKN